MRLTRNQILLERRRNKKLQRVLKEIVQYGKLKEQWGLGHIKIVRVLCDAGCCIKKKKEDRFRDTKIMGCYIDIYDKPKETSLGHDIKEAKINAPIAKNFIYPTFHQIQHADHYEL